MNKDSIYKIALGRSRSFVKRSSLEWSGAKPRGVAEAGSIMDCGWLTKGKVTFRLDEIIFSNQPSIAKSETNSSLPPRGRWHADGVPRSELASFGGSRRQRDERSLRA